MSEPVFVIETIERTSDCPWRYIMIYNVYPDGTKYDPRDDFPELRDLSAHRDKAEEAKALSIKLHKLGPNPKRNAAQKIVNELIAICETTYDKKSEVEKWSHTAVQMPEDIGGPYKQEIKEFLTSRASGKVLETMCGFNSYFENTQNIFEVVAVDFCKEMLERYANPERKRILYDMERIVRGGKMNFFKDGEFDTIGCWGTNYLTEQLPVFTEFARLLSKNGKLLILESESEGYADLVKRYFNPQETANVMEKAGLEPRIERLDCLRPKFMVAASARDAYYLVEGIKK